MNQFSSRDTNRIFDFCNHLALLWAGHCHDLRFGQFISNVFNQIQETYGRDPFYVEESEMLVYIKKYLGAEEI